MNPPDISIRLDFKTVKTMFFDRAKIKNKVDVRTRKVLSKFGAYVRQTARKSIRKRKRSSTPNRFTNRLTDPRLQGRTKRSTRKSTKRFPPC